MNRFLEFLRYCLDDGEPLPETVSEIDWVEMMAWAEQQAIVGIIYSGIEKAGKAISMPFDIMMDWVGYANQIELQNKKTTEVCRVLCEDWDKDGFKCCILKGQSNYAYYPKGMRNRRSCGDVDIWVVPKDKEEKHPVKCVLDYLEQKQMIESLCYLHAEVQPRMEVPVEVHLRPSFLNEPRHHHRLMEVLGNLEQCSCLKEIEGVTLPVMKWEYDLIFQMCHVYRHLLDEGVGLRQVIDYYYLLKSQSDVQRNADNSGMATLKLPAGDDVTAILKRLGMWKFAGALMWVLKYLFGLEDKYLLCKPLEKDGRFLLSEMMMAGNFGQSDPRMAQLKVEKGKTSYQIKKTWRRVKRNMHFVMSYPLEVIWEPVARFWHFCWRKFRLWRL